MYNHEWFLNRLKERRPEMFKEYKFKEKYIKSREPIKAIHLVCGNEVSIIPNSMISRGSGCSICAQVNRAKNQMKSHEKFVRELPKGVKPLEKYRGAHKPIKFNCKLCGKTYKARPNDMIRKGCTRCRGLNRMTIGDVKREINEISRGKYEVISDEYKNPHTCIEIKHKSCGNIYPVTRSNFRQGKRCPRCASSSGERIITEILENRGIEFKHQKTFKKLKYINNLYYDFYIDAKKILIEYQGAQHYKPVEYFGGEEQLKVQKEIDNIKREYAKKNGYRLVEVPYTESTYEDIESYLIKNMIINSVKH